MVFCGSSGGGGSSAPLRRLLCRDVKRKVCEAAGRPQYYGVQTRRGAGGFGGVGELEGWKLQMTTEPGNMTKSYLRSFFFVFFCFFWVAANQSLR